MVTTAEVNQEVQLREELTVVKGVSAITITNQETYDSAVTALQKVKSWRANWKRYWYGDGATGPIPMANKAWKGLLEKFNEADEPADQAERIVKNKILAFDQEQERIRQEAQRKAEEEARQKEEADRAALAAEMEVDGVSDEDIKAVVSAPPTYVAPVVQATYQKASGVSTRANWVCVVTDLKALLKAIGTGKFKLSPEDTAKAVEFFEGLLKKRATADTSTLNIPGCKAENRPVLAGRTR